MPRTGPVPATDCGLPPKFEEYFAQSDRFRSSREEDKTLYYLFFDNKTTTSSSQNLSYVELGAFNGIRESNTRFMDRCLGWTGLLIDANPMKYDKLLEVRPHAHCLQVAPSCSSPTEIGFHSVGYTNAAQANVPNEYDNSTLIQVPCDRFTPILKDILGGYATLVSLDVEGAEDQVLATVDFDQVHVEMWMVENVNNLCPREEDCPSRSRSRKILFGAGYVGYVDVIMGSDLFVFPNSTYDQVLSGRFGDEKRLKEEETRA
eukprot:Nitzschia sp. Nitz4//scaffold24_size164493//39583//40365//NITZ4_002314-RA/size164493-processed-gene-0.224-mRNA-1//-1//CDS//3329544072//8497//frame0